MVNSSRVALTGVGRSRSIGSGLAVGLARDGWDLALADWSPYDDRLGYDRSPDDPQKVAEKCRALGSVELGELRIRANAINPGGIDTGWMTEEIREMGVAETPAGRLGTPDRHGEPGAVPALRPGFLDERAASLQQRWLPHQLTAVG